MKDSALRQIVFPVLSALADRILKVVTIPTVMMMMMTWKVRQQGTTWHL